MVLDYLEIGFKHILDTDGIDHLLFLVALVVVYRLSDWKRVVLLATAFTVGHSLTLALAMLDIIHVNERLIEIMIALTIFLAAMDNFSVGRGPNSIWYRYLTALAFGLIHGLGFSNSLRSMLFDDNIVLPLLGFNLGVEVGQVIIVLLTILIGWLVTDKLKIKRSYWVLSISLVIAVWAIKLLLERF